MSIVSSIELQRQPVLEDPTWLCQAWATTIGQLSWMDAGGAHATIVGRLPWMEAGGLLGGFNCGVACDGVNMPSLLSFGGGALRPNGTDIHGNRGWRCWWHMRWGCHFSWDSCKIHRMVVNNWKRNTKTKEMGLHHSSPWVNGRNAFWLVVANNILWSFLPCPWRVSSVEIGLDVQLLCESNWP